MGCLRLSYYFEFNLHHTCTGSWLSPAPYQQHHSPYMAMSNNPFSFIDPDGGYDYWDGSGPTFGDGGSAIEGNNAGERYLYPSRGGLSASYESYGAYAADATHVANSHSNYSSTTSQELWEHQINSQITQGILKHDYKTGEIGYMEKYTYQSGVVAPAPGFGDGMTMGDLLSAMDKLMEAADWGTFKKSNGLRWHSLGTLDDLKRTPHQDILAGANFASLSLKMSPASFRLVKSGKVNPRLYRSGWTGGSRARIKTFGVSNVGTGLGTAVSIASTAFAINDIYYGNAASITYVDAGTGILGLGAQLAGYAGIAVSPLIAPAVGIYGGARMGYELGIHYGPSKWYGSDDGKWFK